MLVAAAGKHTAHVRDEDGAVHAALHVTEHHRLLDLHPHWLTAVAGHIVGQLRAGTNTRVGGVRTHPLIVISSESKQQGRRGSNPPTHSHQFRVQTPRLEGFKPTHSLISSECKHQGCRGSNPPTFNIHQFRVQTPRVMGFEHSLIHAHTRARGI